MKKLLSTKFYQKFLSLFLIVLTLSSCDFAGTAGTAEACQPVKDILLITDATFLYMPDVLEIGEEKEEEAFGLVSQLVKSVRVITEGTVEQIYRGITENEEYLAIVTSAFVLATILYFVMLAIGATSPDAWEIIKKVIVFGIIYALITDWEVFDTIVVTPTNTLVDGLTLLMGTAFTSEEFGGLNGVFAGADRMLSTLFKPGFIKLMAASLTTGLGGWFAFILLCFMFFSFFMLVIEVVRMYIIAHIGRILMLALLPIMLLGALFNTMHQAT